MVCYWCLILIMKIIFKMNRVHGKKNWMKRRYFSFIQNFQTSNQACLNWKKMRNSRFKFLLLMDRKIANKQIKKISLSLMLNNHNNNKSLIQFNFVLFPKKKNKWIFEFQIEDDSGGGGGGGGGSGGVVDGMMVFSCCCRLCRNYYTPINFYERIVLAKKKQKNTQQTTGEKS